MTFTRNNIPTSGKVYWNQELSAYPDIIPCKRYELEVCPCPGVCIHTHSGFLGFNEQEFILTNGEVTDDTLALMQYEK